MPSIAEQTANQIRADIISGVIAPGAKLREIDMCKQLAVSRTPLREAFRILQSEGYLTYRSNAGVVVNQIALEDIPKIIEVFRSIECIAMQYAAQSITRDELHSLEQLNQQLSQASDEEAAALYEAFHTQLGAATHNQLIIEQLEFVSRRYAMIYKLVPFRAQHLSSVCKEHRDILDSLRAGDATLAAGYAAIHINSIERIAREEMGRGREHGEP